MFPYLDLSEFTIAGVTFHSFGLLVAIGVLIGHAVGGWRAKKLRICAPQTWDVFALCVFAGGFFFGHALDTVFYRPEVVLRDPLELLMLHHGLSSFGGLFGAVAGGLAYVYAKGLHPWLFGDLCTFAFPFAWAPGRLGCTLAHDHKGRLTDSWLAVRFPEGARYDLGLIEFLLTPLIMALVVWVSRRTRRPGMISGAFAVGYAVIRFPLDFLRATDLPESDPRYGGLTPAQWACLLTLTWGLWALRKARTHAPWDPEAARPATA